MDDRTGSEDADGRSEQREFGAGDATVPGEPFHDRLRVEIMEAIAEAYPPEDAEPDDLRDHVGDAVMAVVWPRIVNQSGEIVRQTDQLRRLREERANSGNLHVALAVALKVPTMTTNDKLIDRVVALKQATA